MSTSFTRSSPVKGRLLSKAILHQRLSSIKYRLQSKVVFHPRSSSIEGCLSLKIRDLESSGTDQVPLRQGEGWVPDQALGQGQQGRHLSLVQECLAHSGHNRTHSIEWRVSSPGGCETFHDFLNPGLSSLSLLPVPHIPVIMGKRRYADNAVFTWLFCHPLGQTTSAGIWNSSVKRFILPYQILCVQAICDKKTTDRYVLTLRCREAYFCSTVILRDDPTGAKESLHLACSEFSWLSELNVFSYLTLIYS